MDDREDDTDEVGALVESTGPDQTRTPTDDAPTVGRWYRVKCSNNEVAWLGCAVHIGSNYVGLKGVRGDGGRCEVRLHFNEFWRHCEHVPDPQPIIDEHVLVARTRVNELMNEIKALTARLPSTPTRRATSTSSSTIPARAASTCSGRRCCSKQRSATQVTAT